MYFTETTALHEMERIMREIPNFRPRGHGVIVLRQFEYTADDCDCRFCPHHICSGKRIKCGLENCPCLRERIVAGAAQHKEVILETMSAIRYPPFVKRLRNYLTESEESPMNYRNEKHRAVFMESVKKSCNKNNALLSALYLLTADNSLWNAAKHKTADGNICFEQIKLPDCTESAYTLFCAAKDLYLGTKHLSVSDLADTDLIPPKMFALICNAMAIRRFGLGAIQLTERSDAK